MEDIPAYPVNLEILKRLKRDKEIAEAKLGNKPPIKSDSLLWGLYEKSLRRGFPS